MDLQFLDLHGLSGSEKCHLTNILRPDANIEALTLPWIVMKNHNDVNSVPVTEVPTEIQNSWYNAVTHSYQQQIIASMCNEWQTSPMYNVTTNGHLSSFIPGITYTHPEYINTEIHEVNYNRDNGRRSKTTRNNRAINSANEIQAGYMGDQGQIHQQIPIMFIYPEHHPVPTQQHPVTGQIYYSPAILSSTTHQPHINTTPYGHPAYSTHHLIVPQTNQGNVKPSIAKSHNRRTQNACIITEPTSQKINQNDKKSNVQTNIVVTTTENHSESKSYVKNADNSTANKENVTGNGEILSVDKTIEQNNIKSTVNENNKAAEKNEISLLVINNNNNSNAEVRQNEKIDEKDENEMVTKTASESVSTENEIQIDKNVASKNEQDKTVVIKTQNEESPVAISKTPLTRSWASIVKNNDVESKTPSPPKLTINIDPVHQNELPKIVQKKSKVENVPVNAQNVSSNNTSNVTNDYKMVNGELESFYDDPNLFRMGEFLLHYQMDKQTVSLLPRGLTNRSNYCYINSILQALLACPLFYNLLKALPHPNNYGKLNKHSTTPLIDNMVRFIREFTPLSETARCPRKDRTYKRKDDTVIENGFALEPSYVYTMLKYTSAAGVFPVEGRQEDAEEFLSCLLNGINDEMLELMKLANNERTTVASVENNINHNHNDEEEWKVIGPKNKGSVTRCTELERTPLSDIFRGQLRSRVSRAGEQPTDNVQPFFTLQLDIEKAESVKHALEILVGKDQLEGMTCSKTKKQIEAWKQVTLEELPVILIMHLKWFVYKFSGCSKILKSVQFPIDLKIDSKFLSPNTVKKLGPKQKQYKLFAVTYHDGKEASKGHYVTDAFHVGYGGWVRYDDSSAKGISEQNVLNPTPPRVPYLLYYRRCDTIGNNQSNSDKPR